MQSFHSPVTYTLFDPNVFLCALFSNTLSLCSSNNVRDHITHILWVKRVRRDCRIGRGRTQPIHRTQELGHGYGLTAWTFVCLLVERHITQLHNVRFFLLPRLIPQTTAVRYGSFRDTVTAQCWCARPHLAVRSSIGIYDRSRQQGS